MKTNDVMDLVIAQYAELTQTTIETVKKEILNKDELVMSSIHKLFCIVAIKSGNMEKLLKA